MLYIITKKSDAQHNPLFCCDVNTVPCSHKKVVNASNPQDSSALFVCTYIKQQRSLMPNVFYALIVLLENVKIVFYVFSIW